MKGRTHLAFGLLVGLILVDYVFSLSYTQSIIFLFVVVFTSILPDIDLTPFKGYDWGISRLHASVRAYADKVYVTDLGSSNGTWIDGERISPNNPHELSKGDLFLLGRLRVQILMPD